jgi:hypothetical protein
VKTPLTLLHNKVVASRSKYTDSPTPIFNTSDLDHLEPRVGCFFHQIGVAQFVLREGVDVGNGLAPKALREKLDFVPLHVLYDKDIQAFEEVEGYIIHGVSQNGFLDQKHVAVGFLDLFADVQEILAALLDHFVHLAIVVDYHRVVHLHKVRVSGDSSGSAKTHVRFWRAQLELNYSDFSFLHACRAACSNDYVLVQHDTFYKLGVLYCAADFLDYANIS